MYSFLPDLSYRIHKVFQKKNARRALVLLFILLLNFLSFYVYPPKAQASITEFFVRMDRHAAGSNVTGTVCLKTSTSGTETGVIVVFPTDWTIDTTTGHWQTTTSNLPKDPVGGGSATAWPGIGTPTRITGTSVRFPSNDLSTGTFYCFNFNGDNGATTSQIGSAGNDETGLIQTEGGSPFVDTGNWAASVVSSAGPNDQIAVTASVSATFTFSLTPNSINLGQLTTSSTASGSATQTVSTNARNGYVSWVKGANSDGLHSTVANAGISSPGSYPTITDLSSTPGYGLSVTNVSGTQTIAPGYWTTNNANQAGHIDTTFNQTASTTGPVASNQISLDVHARISATQAAAADYADTLTVVAAGNF